jgi:flagellum-specific ATP synthase
VAGTDPVLDKAIQLNDRIEAFLCQEIHDNTNMLQSLGELTSLFG